jgi:hypothetical protein
MQRSGGTLIDQQPRGITRLDRVLRDAVGRQFVIEVGQTHGDF